MFDWKKLGPQSKNSPNAVKKAYRAWYNQTRRCYDKSNPGYIHYGAKGIGVDYSCTEFIEWFMAQTRGMPIPGINVGRIDHSKNYSLTNIELVSKSENSKERILRAGVPIPKRSLLMFDPNTGEVLGKFSSIKEASSVSKISVGAIWRLLLTGGPRSKLPVRFLEVSR